MPYLAPKHERTKPAPDHQIEEDPKKWAHLYRKSRWRKASELFRINHPLCVCGRAAQVVDHIKSHGGDPRLFWDVKNWQAMCKPCHDKKTSGERLSIRNNVRVTDYGCR